ncbi:hypothetical protein CE91St36_11400 [Christensenellaceae bacterium]|nr:hypothetical protein CE91St36_11400 [Christensenellaceae bacterium]BDF60991.1 hypothetical protein CE91St37_11410 [Christensenellaceae bacterium]
MKRKLKNTICIGLAAILCLAFIACAPAEEEPSASPSTAVQINPLPEAISKDKSSARLYFGFMDQPFLVGESHSFDVPINESIENSVIRELIKGPLSTRTDLQAVINPKTTLVSVRSEGQSLFVTLSNDFLKPVDEKASSDTAYEKTRRLLAVYSIVNTLIEQGTYSRVQILIDDDGMGTGRPLTLSEAGLDGEGAVEALERNGELVLNGANTMREIMQAIENKEWGTLYNYIAYKNLYGQDKPSLDDFQNEVISSKLTISDTAIRDAVIGNDAASEIIMVDYVLKLRDEEAKTLNNIPIKLIQENSIWKISYTVFKRNFLT